MKPYLSAPEFDLWHGDCIEVMRTLPAESVDAVVTDPPYELGFMGKGWDASGIAYRVEVWSGALRVLKPGGHLLAFGGTRTSHRLACAIEDAGFEVRDSIAWMYGSGFPKSLDVSKAIDKNNGEVGRLWKYTAWMRTTGLTANEINKATGTFMGGHYFTDKSQPSIPTPELWQVIRPLCGDIPAWVDELVQRIAAEREVIGSKNSGLHRGSGASVDFQGSNGRNDNGLIDITAPATDAAHQWRGWGTALKPAHEPIVVARKPTIGTVAENVLTHGTGALNIDGCRIAATDKRRPPAAGYGRKDTDAAYGIAHFNTTGKDSHPNARWPANVILDESQAAELDRQSGVLHAPGSNGNRGVYSEFLHLGPIDQTPSYTDNGGASRFFYTAKANSNERPNVEGTGHPTVKPLDLMRYLVRLVTPPGGTVLDPFAGSGTTAEACIIEGFRCITIELTAEYLPLIAQRLTKPIEVTLL